VTVVAKPVAALLALCLVVACAIVGGAPGVASDQPSPTATSTVPPQLLTLFQQASGASSCGMPWTLLAAVAHTESGFSPTALSSAGAEGLFQFEPATFAAYDHPTPTGGALPPTPFDPTDAAYAAARYLCALGVTDNPTSALVAYNCGNPGPACQAISAGYAAQVLATAVSYSAPGNTTSGGTASHNAAADGGMTSTVEPTVVQTAVVAYAESQIGKPDIWGGPGLQRGFDGAGFVAFAYGTTGLVVPQTASAEWDGEPHVAMDHLVPGDLVFFGEKGQVDHVGIAIGNNAMVDAPRPGADVAVETIPTSVRAASKAGRLFGATDPVAVPSSSAVVP